MKLETRYKKTKCIDGCKLFNDKKNYSYWENKKETLDEIEILNLDQYLDVFLKVLN